MCQSSYHLHSPGFYRDCLIADVEGDDDERGATALDVSERDADGARASWDAIAEAAKRIPDVHVASSCLQKALRRGDWFFAQATAHMLLQRDEARLWRRLAVCAFEDFGLCDLGLTAQMVVAARSRNLRIMLGQERLLRFLIGRLCATAKDRRLDEIYMVGDFARRDQCVFERFKSHPLENVLAPLVHETVRLMVRCERAVPGRSYHALDGGACERALLAMGDEGLADEGLFWLCNEGRRASQCLLPVLLPLAINATDEAGGRGVPVGRALPAAPEIGGVPAYAIDGFTRSGRAMLERLRAREPRVIELLKPVPPKDRFDALRILLFYAEGGCCTPELADPLLEALTEEGLSLGSRLPRAEASLALGTLRSLLSTIHALRDAFPPMSDQEM